MALQSLVQPILKFVHAVYSTFRFIYNVSSYIGGAICSLLIYGFHFAHYILISIVAFGIELFYMIAELSNAIDAFGKSVANGVDSCIKGVFYSYQHVRQTFVGTQQYVNIMAGRIDDTSIKVRGAFSIIVDCLWWLLTIVPRILISLCVSLLEGIIFGTAALWRLLISMMNAVLSDIFRFTLIIFVIYVLMHYSQRLRMTFLAVLRLCWRRFKTFLRAYILRRSGPQDQALQRSRLPRGSRSPSIIGKDLDSYRCVVCRDRLKCVLLLPCRHLCLCEECADYMAYETRTQDCPLCRRQIINSMSVYT